MANLKDIAKASGFHVTTVASVLNGTSANSRCAESTRQKILATAEKLGYTRNKLARGLRIRRTQTVGLIAGNLQNPFFANLSYLLEKELKEAKHDLVLTCHGTDSLHDEKDLVAMLIGRAVDGLLIWSESRNGEIPKFPKNSDVSHVWLGYGPDGENAVLLDIAYGLRLALDHLNQSGAKKIGYFAPESARVSGLPNPRPELLREVNQEMGLAEIEFIFASAESWNLETLTECALQAVDVAKSAGVDAILTYNDLCAVAWQMAAAEKGEHFRIVGFDGSPLIKAFLPRIPYINLHSEALATHAVELLLQLIKGEKGEETRKVILPTLENV